MRLLWLSVVGLRGRLSRKRDLRHGIAGFQLAQVVKDRLFDQPVWRAIDALRSQFDALTCRVIQFYTHGGCSHDSRAP